MTNTTNYLTGIELIAQERHRQIEQEGWTPEHDDHHRDGELALAASAYSLPPANRLKDQRYPPAMWPACWSIDWWKPSPNDRIKELGKAGALIAAEIDRLQRKEQPQ